MDRSTDPEWASLLLRLIVTSKRHIEADRARGHHVAFAADSFASLAAEVARVPVAIRNHLDESMRLLVAYAADPSARPTWTTAEARELSALGDEVPLT